MSVARGTARKTRRAAQRIVDNDMRERLFTPIRGIQHEISCMYWDNDSHLAAMQQPWGRWEDFSFFDGNSLATL